MNTAGEGYAWTLTADGLQLDAVAGNARTKVDSSTFGLRPDDWSDLRVEANGPYVRCFVNNRLVLENYDEKRS